MTSAPKTLSQEIAQSAQKILKHLNEIEGPEKTGEQEESTEFINLLSSLQTEESASLLQDVSRWTEARKSEYQKYEQPLLNQVEKNQSILEHATNDAIPALQGRMDDFDLKLTSAKSHLVTLSESVVNTAQSAVDAKAGKGKANKMPQLQLEATAPPLAPKDETRNEEIEIIQQLKLRQEHFMSTLQDLDREIKALKLDLQTSNEYSINLEKENAQLKCKVETLEKKSDLSHCNVINMEVFGENIELEILASNDAYEIPFDETQYKIIKESDEEEEEEDKEEMMRKLMNNMRNYEFFTTDIPPLDDYILIPRSELPNSGLNDSYDQNNSNNCWEKFGAVGNCHEEEEETEEEKIRKEEEEARKREEEAKEEERKREEEAKEEARKREEEARKREEEAKEKERKREEEAKEEERKREEEIKKIEEEAEIKRKELLAKAASITGEISYEIRTNEKGEIVFSLSDGSGAQIDVSPEFAEEMQNELQKDLQHLIEMNANSSYETTDAETITEENNNYYGLFGNRTDMATTPTSARRINTSGTNSPRNFRGSSFEENSDNLKPYSVRASDGARSPKDSIENKLASNKRRDFLNSDERPQPIIPIGIRQKEGDNGYRLFFKDRNDAIVVDTNVRRRTRDGLIILNSPTPNIRIRIENGFAPDFVSRCRDNPNFHFILQPYHPEGSSSRVVGLCENKSNTLQPNFFRDTRSTACVWSSFPVRPPPHVCRSPYHRPLTKNEKPATVAQSQSTRHPSMTNYQPLLRHSQILKPKPTPRRKSPDTSMIHRQNYSVYTFGNI